MFEKHPEKHPTVDHFCGLFLAFVLSGCATEQVSTSSSQPPHSTDTDYRRLEQLLQQQDWQAADRETFHQLLVLTDREDAGWLGAEDVERISCEDWTTLNQLWQTHSDRRFSFRIQARIWERVGGTVGQYDPNIAQKVGEVVGWRSEDRWKPYDELDFSLQANPGHLPATTGNGVSGGLWGGIATIAGRVDTCTSEVDPLPDALQAAEREVQQNQQTIQSEQSCIGCYLVGADLRGMNLTFKDLAHADLRNANLEGAILGAANLKFADLRGANLERAILRQANLWGASFDGANLNGADFSCGGGSCTYMQEASFQDASLIGANLECLDCTISGRQGLVHVNLAGANLTDARVNQTSFEGVNLCGAILPNGRRSQQGC